MLPEIRARGGVVEAIIISHPDLDHYSGAADIMRFARVRRLIVHDSMIAAAERAPPVQELMETANRHGVSLELVSAGDKLRFGYSTWNVLWPPKGMRAIRDNDVSLVVRVDLSTSPCETSSAAVPASVNSANVLPHPQPQRGAVLLCGDIETFGCASLLAEHVGERNELTATVMELPHHGSWRDAVVPLIHRCDPSVIVQSTAARRFRMDRFGGVLPTTSSRLVTCRDGAIRIEFRTQDVRAFVYDELAARNWRPSGRWRRSRVRPLCRSWRALKSLVTRAVWRPPSTGNDRRTLKQDPISNDAIPTIAQLNDNDRARVCIRPNYEHLHTFRRVEGDCFTRSVLKSKTDLDFGIRRCRFHDSNNTCQQCSFDLCGLRKRKPNSARTFDRDICASKKESLTPCDVDKARRVVEVTLRRVADVFERAIRQWNESIWSQHACNRISRTVIRGWFRSRFRKPLRRELESPAYLSVESQAASCDQRSIRSPYVNTITWLRRHLCECDRSDPTHRNRSTRRVGCRRCSLLNHFFNWLSTRISTFRNWLLRLVINATGPLLGRRLSLAECLRLQRRDRDVFIELVDKASQYISVDEQDSIRVWKLWSTSVSKHPQCGDLLQIDRDRTDPSVIPHRDPIHDTKSSRNALSVDRLDDSQRERCCAQERDLGLLSDLGRGTDCRTQSFATNDERDDLTRWEVLQRGHSCIANQHGPLFWPDVPKASHDPSTVVAQNTDNTCLDRLLLNGCGIGRPYPLRVLRFHTDSVRNDDLILSTNRVKWARCPNTDQCHDAERLNPTGNDAVSHNRTTDSNALTQTLPRKDRRKLNRFPGRWLRRIAHDSPLALEDGEISLRHLQHNQCHRGAIRIADLLIGPRAVRVLLGDEFFPNSGPPVLPTLSAGEIHGLNRVVVPVKVMLLGEASPNTARRSWECVARQIVETTIDRFVLVDTGIEKARDARRRPRPKRSAYLFHVAESPVVVLARTNVSNRIVDRRLRNLDSSVSSTSECHDLTDCDRHVGVGRNRVVAPATLIVLATHDQLHGADQRVTNPIVVLVHPVNLAQEQRSETMSVHRTMGIVRNEEPSLSGVGEDEIERLLNAVSELTSSGHIAVCHQRNGAEARDSDMLTETSLPERPVRLLHTPQGLEPALNRFLKLRRDLLGQRCILRSTNQRLRSLDTILLGRLRGLLRSRGLTLILRSEVTPDEPVNQATSHGNFEGVDVESKALQQTQIGFVGSTRTDLTNTWERTRHPLLIPARLRTYTKRTIQGRKWAWYRMRCCQTRLCAPHRDNHCRGGRKNTPDGMMQVKAGANRDPPVKAVHTHFDASSANRR